MRRLFWIGLGAAVGVLAVRKVQQTADSLSPSGVAGSVRSGLAGLTDAVRDFSDEVQVAMLERETDLRTALGLDDNDTPVDTPLDTPVDTPVDTPKDLSHP